MPVDTNEAVIAGDTARTSLNKLYDIRAEWLGLPSDFKGSYTLNPEQRQFGIVLENHQPLVF